MPQKLSRLGGAIQQPAFCMFLAGWLREFNYYDARKGAFVHRVFFQMRSGYFVESTRFLLDAALLA
jgi:hypothetical protein